MPQAYEVTIKLAGREDVSRSAVKAERSLSRLGKRGSRAMKRISGAGDRVRGSIQRVVRQLFSLKGAIAGIGVGLLVRSFHAASASAEALLVQLETVTGSAQRAKEIFGETELQAASTPFEIENLVQVRALLESIGLAGKRAVRQIGDAAAGMARPIMDVAAAVISLETEPLRRLGIQMSRVGKTAVFAFRDQMGRAIEKVATGSFADLQRALLDVLDVKFKGGMERFSKTWKGMWSNLMDQASQFKRDVGEAGVFDFMKEGLRLVLEKIDQLKKQGRLDEWAKKISDASIDASIRVLGIGIATIDMTESVLNFMKSNPVIFEFGLIGLVFFGRKGALVLAGIGLAIEGIKAQLKDPDIFGPLAVPAELSQLEEAFDRTSSAAIETSNKIRGAFEPGEAAPIFSEAREGLVGFIADLQKFRDEGAPAVDDAVRIVEDGVNLTLTNVEKFSGAVEGITRATVDGVVTLSNVAAEVAGVVEARMGSTIEISNAAKGAIEAVTSSAGDQASVARDKLAPALDAVKDESKRASSAQSSLARSADFAAAAFRREASAAREAASAISRLEGGGGSSFPSFGHGGIVSRPTLALVGEAGRELIVPERREQRSPATQRAFDELAAREPGGGSEITIVVPVNLDGKQIAKVVARHVRRGAA